IGLEEEISIVAYCLMDNHIHLIIKGELDDISMALKRVNIKYAMNFNVNNDRVGHVFQGRYKSEIIADDKYLLQVVRYIHNNPVNAKMVTNISSYKWSSYNEYIKGKYNVVNPEEASFIMDFFSGKQNLFREFHNETDFIIYLDTKEEVEARRLDISKALIYGYFDKHNIKDFSKFKEDKEHQKRLIKILLEKSQISHRQIAALLEVKSSTVHAISSNM
ncbi:MAG: transposase, partial [Clostridium sp.]|nr:transposase [Clostridium sp.]